MYRFTIINYIVQAGKRTWLMYLLMYLPKNTTDFHGPGVIPTPRVRPMTEVGGSRKELGVEPPAPRQIGHWRKGRRREGDEGRRGRTGFPLVNTYRTLRHCGWVPIELGK
jgi:hypothetical protein